MEKQNEIGCNEEHDNHFAGDRGRAYHCIRWELNSHASSMFLMLCNGEVKPREREATGVARLVIGARTPPLDISTTNAQLTCKVLI